MTNITVIGASGFVGRNLVEHLAETDNAVKASDITSVEHPKNVEFINSNIMNYESICEAIAGSDIVVHLATSNLTTSLKNPRLNVQVNVDGTVGLLEACRKFDVKKIIFTSASSVYGVPQYLPVDEEHPKRPTTVYGVTKYASEHFIRVYQELYGLDYFIFRFTNVYGPKQFIESRGLIPIVITRILNDEAVDLYGDGSQTRDFVYVGDIAKFITRVAKEDIKNEVTNLGTGKDTPIKTIVDLCGKHIGKEPNINYKPQEKGERKGFQANMGKCQEIFGEIPSTTIDEGLKQTIEWHKKEHGC